MRRHFKFQGSFTFDSFLSEAFTSFNMFLKSSGDESLDIGLGGVIMYTFAV